jgi:hypothetical protein
VAFGSGCHGIFITRQKGPGIWGGRIKTGETTFSPVSPSVHLYVVLGKAYLESYGTLIVGDAVRRTGKGIDEVGGILHRQGRYPYMGNGYLLVTFFRD